MGHNHDHHHHHGSNNKKALLWAFLLISLFMFVEVIGGILTNSLALLSDAGHMLSDAAALGLSLLAVQFGQKKADQSKTYGYKRFEILAAFINGLALIVIAILIVWEAVKRFSSPPEIAGSGMLLISSIGLLVNIAAAFILMMGDKEENLNVRSAFLHVLGDLLGSVGAIIAALLIMFFNWGIADPIASLLVAVLIAVSGFRVTKDSFHVLMEGVPANIPVEKVKQKLEQIDGVCGIHDLHVWVITSDFPALSCHIAIQKEFDGRTVIKAANQILHDEFGLHHTTIQIDEDGEDHSEHEHCN
ncbi:cation transporter [Metabacillus sp. KIGAM252]|uniref:Cation transporter n=1 Tax=Metabacillus flavus TaxID=2823519 RepID=A0ABS5LBP5_9BACI|nr:cation diffusion facilitator family transporter [Metabacillus flavus]MBS2968146.1 cation transporter [Metabacillus flavus]